MGKVSLYTRLIASQVKNKFKKSKEYSIPRCGVSYTKMTKLVAEVGGIKVVEDQDTKATVFKVKAKAPESIYALGSQMGEFIVSTISAPSRKDQKRLNELGAYLKELEPQMKDLDLYKEASSLLK